MANERNPIPFVTLQDAAAQLGYSIHYTRKLALSGRLPYVRVQGNALGLGSGNRTRILVALDAVEAWQRGRGVKPS